MNSDVKRQAFCLSMIEQIMNTHARDLVRKLEVKEDEITTIS